MLSRGATWENELVAQTKSLVKTKNLGKRRRAKRASIYDVRIEGGSRNTPNLQTNGIHIADKEGKKVKLEGNALITCGEGELEGGQFFSLHI